MNREKLLQDLQQMKELTPDEYDGSYELVREIVSSYSRMDDYSLCDYPDLNAIYALAIGTWKLNPEKKKEYVQKSHLPESEKERIAQTINRIWDNACHERYAHKEGKGPSVGMFGTGFYSFLGMTTPASVQGFIKMIVDINEMEDDIQIYNRADRILNRDFMGMGSASASFILHCLKPFTFPILNGNSGNLFRELGVELRKAPSLETYIENCRKVKAFRDANLPFRNYRVIDLWFRKIDAYRDEYIPKLEDYDPGISREQYEELLSNPKVVQKTCLDTIYYLFKMGGEASCKQIAERYGNTDAHYNANAMHTGKWIRNATGCPLRESEKEGGYWAVLFQGRYAQKEEKGVFIWRLRQPLADAVATLDAEGFFKEFDMSVDKCEFDLNTILYGPPGTGKTYNTVLYSVAIIEKKSLDIIQEEAKQDYAVVKNRFDQYKKTGRIAFTTFHQSYGYEEFIEGIKPRLSDEDTESSLEYTVEPGVFMSFCERASSPVLEDIESYGFNQSPTIWKVSLGGSHENPVREECLKNNHIRIGWDEYGEEITDDVEYRGKGKIVLNAFINKMKKGDVVLSCYSADTIDAIGVIVGDYEWNDTYREYKRVRNVKWIVKNIRENILELNGGTVMTLLTVYQLKISLSDVMAILSKLKQDGTISKPTHEKDRYVFVIDEINRGNISKIFGELITLIEKTKRIGAKEEMTVKLPYSPNKLFGVPDNVYILGTMNTADRSIALLDTALRRRFSFVEMMPDADVLRSIGADIVVENGETIDVARMLEIINRRIEYLYDREHTIGHAFFTKLCDNPSVEALASIFEKEVIPLLQEYFYEDYRKIQYVLGDDGKRSEENKKYQFIRDEDIDVTHTFNTPPDWRLPEKRYVIQKEALREVESYKLIGEGI